MAARSQAVKWQGGSLQCLRLGAPLFDARSNIHPAVRFADLAAFVWLRETGNARPSLTELDRRSPWLGRFGDTDFVLLFNGILIDQQPTPATKWLAHCWTRCAGCTPTPDRAWWTALPAYWARHLLKA